MPFLYKVRIFAAMKRYVLIFLAFMAVVTAGAQLAPLHVEGQFFKDDKGNNVVLHGFAQTFSPWFNEQGTKWTGFDVQGCLNYNKGIIDGIMNAGWKMTFSARAFCSGRAARRICSTTARPRRTASPTSGTC